MKKLSILLFLFIYAFAVAAQDKTGVGVFVDPKRLTNEYARKIFNGITNHMKVSARNNYVHYDWAENVNAVTFNPVRNKDNKEQPVKLLVFMAPTVQYEKNPKLQFQQDSAGNTTRAYYNSSFKSEIWVKVIDFTTSEVVQMKIFEENGNGATRPATVEVRDYKKYFSGDPNKIDRKLMREQTKEVDKVYHPRVKKIHNSAADAIAKSLRSVPGWLNGLQDEKLYTITNMDAASLDKKLVEFEMSGSKNDFLAKYDLFELYEVIQVGEYKTTNKLGYATVREIGETVTKMKTLPFKRKNMAEAVKSGREIYLVRNPRALEKFNTADDRKYTISIDKKCILCDVRFETSLNSVTNVVIIERAHMNILNTLAERYKNERFMDYNLEEIQGRQKGVEILVSKSDRGMRATEVKTGRVLDTEDKTYGGKMAKMFLEIFDEQIKILEVSEQKKNKLIEVIAYHPFGFFLGDRVQVFTVQEEKVGGRTLDRNTQIGKGFVNKVISPKVARIKIQDGKKEIYEAMNSDAKVKFHPREKN